MSLRTTLVLALALLGCSKGGGGGGGTSRDGLLEAWKTGGLAPSAFAAATTPVGKDCTSGTVNNVDVLVCAFATAEEAKQAEDAGLAWVGDTTGMSQARGALVIAAADRRKADPSGRTINKLMKLAPK
ncbi:MAG: hypothetical protein H0T79_14180 [Deltaproteobacteria bacterium]|nr:hypothetical protein [Deltaproteobacteria bacterium]